MSRTRIALAVLALAAGAAALFLVPTLFFRPWALDHFYTRLFVQFAGRRPMLLSQLEVLEPVGLRFHNDDLDDFSAAFQLREADWLERQLAILKRYRRDRLPPAERLSYDTVEWFLEDVARGRPFMFHDLPLNQFSGVQSSLPEFLLTSHRIEDLADASDYVARVAKIETAFAQVREGLELRRQRGILAPRFVLRLAQREMKELIAVEPERHPLYLHLGARLEQLAVAPAAAAELRQRLRATLAGSLYPAYRELIVAAERLEAAAGDDIGAWRLPAGTEFYDYALDHHATLDVSAREVHRQGLAEVERLTDEIRAVQARLGLVNEEPAAAIRRLAREPRFLHAEDPAGRQRLLADYRAILAEMEGGLDELFEAPPLLPVRVEPVPGGKESGAPAAYYQPPPPDGSAGGTFYVNLGGIGRMPRFSMRTLAYHEALPGHHLQSTMAPAEASAPLLRRLLPLTAYVEGWALYAERLAAEHGFLEDPYDRLGYLEAELFRAVRLVVDTGIHDRRWNRERAVDYLLATTGLSRPEALVEVERQIVNPGQACAYKIGQLALLRLRARARGRLAERFDLRRFHTLVLENGALPLTLLERVVEQWIAEQSAEAGG